MNGWWIMIHDHSSVTVHHSSYHHSVFQFQISWTWQRRVLCLFWFNNQKKETLPPPRNYKGNQGMSTKFLMVSGDSFNFSDELTTPNLYLPSSEPSSWAPIVDPSLTEVMVSHNDLFIDALGVKFQLTSEQKLTGLTSHQQTLGNLQVSVADSSSTPYCSDP